MRPVTGSLWSASNFSIAALVAWSSVPETVDLAESETRAPRCALHRRGRATASRSTPRSVRRSDRCAARRAACVRGAARGRTAAVAPLGAAVPGRERWSRCRAGIGHLRPCRIGEKWRRMKARLQEDRVDDDDHAGSTGAKIAVASIGPMRMRCSTGETRLRPRHPWRAAAGPRAGFWAAAHALFFTVSRHSTRDPRLRRSDVPAGGHALRRADRQMGSHCAGSRAAEAFARTRHVRNRSGSRTVTRVPSPSAAADVELAAVQSDQPFDDRKIRDRCRRGGGRMTCARLEVRLADPRRDPRSLMPTPLSSTTK